MYLPLIDGGNANKHNIMTFHNSILEKRSKIPGSIHQRYAENARDDEIPIVIQSQASEP